MKKACIIGGNGKLGKVLSAKIKNNYDLIRHEGRKDVNFCEEIEVKNFFAKIKNLNCLIFAVGEKIEESGMGDFNLFKKIFLLNFFSVFLCCKYAIPVMEEGSSIVIIGSVDGCFGNKSTMYSTAKSAVHFYTRCLSKEIADRDVKLNINCIALGTLSDHNIEECATSILKISESPYINGQVIRIDGGHHTFPC